MSSLKKNKIVGLILAAGKSGRIGEPKAFLKINEHTFISELVTKLCEVCEKIVIVFGFDGECMKSKLLSDENLKHLHENLFIEINRNYESGMFSSLQCGLAKIKSLETLNPQVIVSFDSRNETSNKLDDEIIFDPLNEINSIKQIDETDRSHNIDHSKGNEFDFILIHQVDQPSLPKSFYREFISQIEKDLDWLQPSYLGKIGHPILISNRLVDKILLEDIDSNLREFRRKISIKQKIWECQYPEIHQDIDTKEDYDKLIKELSK